MGGSNLIFPISKSKFQPVFGAKFHSFWPDILSHREKWRKPVKMFHFSQKYVYFLLHFPHLQIQMSAYFLGWNLQLVRGLLWKAHNVSHLLYYSGHRSLSCGGTHISPPALRVSFICPIKFCQNKELITGFQGYEIGL